MAGTTANGSTSYPVTVRIDDMGELLPGMNATAKIPTASVKNVLALPNAALVRGSYVLVTKDSPSAANADPDMTAPEGYVYVPVKIVVSDDDYTQIISGVTGSEFGWAAFIAGAFTSAVPGIIVHIILIPVLVMSLQKAGFLKTEPCAA